MPEEVGKEITESISIPAIGIGAGRFCDGQILVITDMLGMDPMFTPHFVKKYRDLYEEIKSAVGEYIEDIKTQKFPSEEHVFHE